MLQVRLNSIHKNCSGEKDVIKAWDDWNKLFCPKSDDVQEYLNDKSHRSLFKLPLLYLFQSDRDNKNLPKLVMHDSSLNFKWHEGVVIALPSVRSKYDQNPPLPRQYIGSNVVSQESFNSLQLNRNHIMTS